MQQYEAEEDAVNAHAGRSYEQPQPHLLSVNSELDNMHMMSSDLDLNELNRRTLTQEQFDAFAQQDVMMSSGQLANMLSHDPEAFNKFIAEYNGDYAHISQQPPMLQVAIDQSTLDFSNAPIMQTGSGTSSEWDDSRSSSAVSLSQSFEQHTISTPLSQIPSNQWQPGQSVPVDFNQLNQVFQKVAQAKQMPEWSTEELVRRDSSTSLITQSLGNVGLQTPVTNQPPTFKSPTPVSSLAARRQRARPAPLGLASLRSQSYSGTAPLGSPGTMQPPNSTPPQLRRIKSSNVVGGVAQGRVQKNVAPPQRSPLNWTFSDALTSPQATRHSQSASSLAPPTPMSPPENLTPEQQLMQAQQQWHAKHINAPASITETEAEHAIQYTTAQHFASPPHTPMFPPHHQQFLPPQIIPGNMIMENTPPQSAPASQQTFPQGVFAHSPHHMHQYSQPVIMPQHMPQPMQMYMPQPQMPQPQMVSMMEQEQMAPPHFAVSSAPTMQMPMHFAQNGVPIIDASGQISLAMPSQMQFVQQKPRPESKKSGSIPPGSQTTFSVAGPDMMPLQVTAQVPRVNTQSTDFFVHEYTPPQDIKRTVTPRKAMDNGPKNYTFANQTPEHFEKTKSKTSGGSSPESAISA